jgi:hypothetical protein
MNESKPDRLETLRDNYREKIVACESEIRRLKERLALVEEVLKDAQQLPLIPDGNRPEFSTRYSGMTLTKAAYDAVQRIGGNGGTTAQDIANFMQNNGYQHKNPKWFLTTVILTLKRLATADKIKTEKVGGRRIYKIMA